MSTPKDILTQLPRQPGVYLFKDAEGDILYVGKAKNLKNRVSSYFANNHPDRPWTAVLVGLTRDIETIVVTNELEALMLESTLIKQHLPRFNIKLTDDKSYPFIKAFLNEPIPRLGLVRQHDKSRLTGRGDYIFGPYLSGRAANQTLEFLRRLYGVHVSPRPLKTQDRPCLNCQLDGFACPLAGEVDETTYRERLAKAIEFLQGKQKNLVRDLAERMTEAAERHEFELAAKLRDRYQAIEQVLGHQKVVSVHLDDYDAIGSARSDDQSAIAVLRVRDGRLVSQYVHFFASHAGEDEAELIRQFLIATYPTFADLPGLVALPVTIVDQEAIGDFLTTNIGRRLEVRTAERGDKRRMVELANRNAETKLELTLIKNDQAYAGIVELKELLKLDFWPERIEAVDISNLGASEAVGATICFIGGKPDKNEYRRYKIKTVESQNDFAMIREVTHRRFHDQKRAAPDLYMVDGGPEQLKKAIDGLTGAPMQPRAIISLAKNPDRIFLPDHKRPLPVSRHNKGLLLLSRIRDEVHRFGIAFQRNRQRRKSLATND